MSMRVLLSRNGQSMETCLDALVLVFVDIDQRRNNIVHKGRPEKKNSYLNIRKWKTRLFNDTERYIVTEIRSPIQSIFLVIMIAILISIR